ncbi:MAG: hypothetical protein P0Y66_22270 [Candidatus Kaistia colombiensis]|nr:MAG: hypothetical protein P0Y66_22270 [Kaistia sp.]
MSKDPLSKIRAGNVFKQLRRILQEFRIDDADWSVVDKRPHPELTFRYCGRERRMNFSGTPSRQGTARNEAHRLRRILKEMQMAALGGEPAPAGLPAVADASDIGVHMIEDRPLVLDTDIGVRLGMARPSNIRQVIEANRQEIEAFGSLHAANAVIEAGKGARREVSAFYLSEEQALLVCTLSRAPKAPATRAMLIRVFVALRRGQLPAFNQQALARQIAAIVDDKITKALPALVSSRVDALVSEAVLSRSANVVNMVPALTVIDWAGVSDRHGLRGLSVTVSNALRRFLADRGVAVQLASLAAETRYVFDPALARQWLEQGGRRLIHRIVAEKQGQLRLAVA